MKKKSLSILTIVTLAMMMVLPEGIVFATDLPPTPVTSAPASTYGVEYQAQIQNIGWQAPVSTIGDVDIATAGLAGTVGQGLRIEAIKISGINLPMTSSIDYEGQVQNIGWQPPSISVYNSPADTIDKAPISGTVGRGLRVEGFKMSLSDIPGYEIEYQAQVQNIGWQKPVFTDSDVALSTATIAGTQNQGLRMEALRLEIIKTPAEQANEITAINAVQQAEYIGTDAAGNTAFQDVKLVYDQAVRASLIKRLEAIVPIS